MCQHECRRIENTLRTSKNQDTSLNVSFAQTTKSVLLARLRHTMVGNMTTQYCNTPTRRIRHWVIRLDMSCYYKFAPTCASVSNYDMARYNPCLIRAKGGKMRGKIIGNI